MNSSLWSSFMNTKLMPLTSSSRKFRNCHFFTVMFRLMSPSLAISRFINATE